LFLSKKIKQQQYNEITIKINNQYSKEFEHLLKDYYLNL